MLRSLRIPMVFTFEVSNGLYEDENKYDHPFDKMKLNEAGRIVGEGLYLYMQIEMKMPKKEIKAKVDTNKYQRNIIYSQKRM